jgi:hypothetical protein
MVVVGKGSPAVGLARAVIMKDMIILKTMTWQTPFVRTTLWHDHCFRETDESERWMSEYVSVCLGWRVARNR